MKNQNLTILFCVLCFLKVGSQDLLLLKSSGKVVIGDTAQITTPGNYNLYVQNGILTEKVKVSLKTTTEWSDGAFIITPTIVQVAKSIKENQHLIDIPSAETLVQDGYELKNMDAKLLQQIEWLWQHMIVIQEENKQLKTEMNALKSKLLTSKK